MSTDNDDIGLMVDHAKQQSPNTGPAPVGDDDRCPKCGGETTFGYGLAGGGMGVYWICDSDACDYFFKRLDAE